MDPFPEAALCCFIYLPFYNLTASVVFHDMQGSIPAYPPGFVPLATSPRVSWCCFAQSIERFFESPAALLLLLSKWWISEKQQICFTSVLPWQCHIWILCLFVPGRVQVRAVTESLGSESRWWFWWSKAISCKAHSEHVLHLSGSVLVLPADSHEPAFCRLKIHKLLNQMEKSQWIPGFLKVMANKCHSVDWKGNKP